MFKKDKQIFCLKNFIYFQFLNTHSNICIG